LPPIRLAGDGRVGSSAVGRGERNPLKTPGVGCPSCPKGYTEIVLREDFGGRVLPAPGELDVVFPKSSFFPEAAEAGVDLAEEGLRGSLLLPESLLALLLCSLGDPLPLILLVLSVVVFLQSPPAPVSSSTTRSPSLLSPSLSSFFIFFASGIIGPCISKEAEPQLPSLL
jgi:hypothetical protein